jgi:hypothetical protein
MSNIWKSTTGIFEQGLGFGTQNDFMFLLHHTTLLINFGGPPDHLKADGVLYTPSYLRMALTMDEYLPRIVLCPGISTIN